MLQTNAALCVQLEILVEATLSDNFGLVSMALSRQMRHRTPYTKDQRCGENTLYCTRSTEMSVPRLTVTGDRTADFAPFSQWVCMSRQKIVQFQVS
jgi:hypothetical protein